MHEVVCACKDEKNRKQHEEVVHYLVIGSATLCVGISCVHCYYYAIKLFTLC